MKTFRVQAGLIVLITLFIASSVLYLGSSTISQVREIKSQWALYTADSANSSFTLEGLLSRIGYGGFIHQFKNLILRQDLTQIRQVESTLHAALQDIETYKRYSISNDEKLALDELANVLEIYRGKVSLLRGLLAQNLPPHEIDRQLRVDDTAALIALNVLSEAAVLRSEKKRLELSSAIEESMRNLYVASLILPAIIVTALLLVLFIYRLFKVNEQKEESILFFDRLFEATPDALLTVTESGRINRINEKMSELTGYDKSKLKHMTIEQLMPKRFRNQHQRLRQSFFDLPHSRGMAGLPSLFVEHKSGHEIPVEISLNYLEHRGKITAIAVIRDVSARKASEEKIRLSEAQLINAQKISRLGNWSLSTNNQEMHWSEEVYRILGIDRLGIPSPNLDHYFSQTIYDYSSCRQSLLSPAQNATHYKFERRIQLPDNSIRYLREQGEFERDKNGQVTRVIGTVQDISEEKNLSRSLEQAAAVFENITDAVIIVNAERKIVAINRAFSQITGYGIEESLGQDPGFTKSDRHNKDFYREMNQTLESHGHWQGEIWDRRKNGEVYPKWLNIISATNTDGESYFIGVFSDISHQKATEEKLLHQAMHDPLTGLPNRLSLQQKLARSLKHAEQYQRQVAILFLDLDHFKTVNDSLGHPIGDELLKVLSGRLQNCVRAEDIVARLGGDEFMVVLENLSHTNPVERIAKNIQSELSRPVTISNHDLYVTPSIGISLYPRDGHDVTSLIKNADVAMYRAKEMGRNCYQFYSQDLAEHALRRLSMERDLRQAIIEKQFILHYQPQFNLHTGDLEGAEALVRWIHPDKGMIPPDQFIPLAEESQLIIPLGEWVLRSACAQLSGWRQRGFDLPRISVNLAGPQITNSDICGLVKEVLHTSCITPDRLELEVTETFIMKNQTQGIPVLEQLRDLGIQLAIDDFGTGYSSLSQLKHLPIHKLKVDRSFVKDIPQDTDDVAITRAIVALGKSMHLSITAEGIETKEQHNFLRELSCNHGQGYMYSQPIDADEFYIRCAKNNINKTINSGLKADLLAR